jgi:hypothetical protein
MGESELRILRSLFGDEVAEHSEGNLRLISLPKVTLPDGCRPDVAFGVYVASRLDGYESRIYFEHPIRLKSGAQPQTTTRVILGRTLYAASIQGVSATLPPHQAILEHLRRYEAAA